MPATKIEKPTEFATWLQSRTLFDAGVGATETYVFDGPDGARADVRLAYGKCQQGFWFFITMTRAQEAQFQAIYKSWRAQNQTGQHVYTAAGNDIRPPMCGTPNTPPCGVPQLHGPAPIKCGAGCLCAGA